MQLYQFFYTYEEQEKQQQYKQQYQQEQETLCSQRSISYYNDSYVNQKEKKVIQNMVFEYLPHNLQNLLDPQITTQYLSFQQIQSYFKQFITGLAHMHKQKIIHRDLKPDNLFIDQDYKVLKIGDFGSAKILSKGCFKTPRIYNQWYRPPECFMGYCNYDCSADIWAAGCILAQMISKEVLIQGENEQTQIIEILKVLGAPDQAELNKLKKISKNFQHLELLTKENLFQKQDIFSFLSLDHYQFQQLEAATDLINRMLKYVPGERLTAKQILEHRFFKL